MQNNGSRPTSAASSSNATIRPRNRRLISLNDEDENTVSDSQGSSYRSSSNNSTPFPSRGASPIPKSHPSRSQNASPDFTARQRPNGVATRTDSRFEVGNPASRQASSIWGTSWSSLQGLASSVLGSEPMQDDRKRQKGMLRVPAWKKASQAFTGGTATRPEWGPAVTSPAQLNPGTMEERRAFVQAKKREALLLANAHEHLDASGRYKRRGSDGRAAPSTGQVAEDSDQVAYVYVHNVATADTIAGVTIRYGCNPNIFRKVNRFWPNDTIQTKQTVLLPVDACTVRGKRMSDESAPDLLNSVPGQQKLQGPETPTMKSPAHTRTTSQSSNPSLTLDQEDAWIHSHWVQIENFPDTVSVARISRRALGFFPPARRKSVTFSDLSPPTSRSPSTSFDLGSRLNLQQQPSSLTSSPRGSRQPYSRNRSSSGSYFASRLHGPGGVGTLRGSKAVSPGPAQDSLNRVLGPHLPSLAPRSSFESIHSETSRVSSSTGLENVGGAIEGWVRKMAGKAATSWAEGTHQKPLGDGGGRMHGAGGHWVAAGWGGDLIELGTPFEIGEDEEDEHQDTGAVESEDATPRAGRFEEDRTRTASTGRETPSMAAAHQDGALRGRFPSRGRPRASSFGKSKGD
ncbi:MAG: hypothetical protein Q9160_000045 [Pyrenula sp. 1 TL-2023]